MHSVYSLIRRLVFLLLLVGLTSSALIAQQDNGSTTDIYIPDVSSALDRNESGLSPIYRPVVTLAELPAIHVYDANAKPLPPREPPARETTHVQTPVALASYEEESPLAPEGLSWIGDPVFAFGSGLFPVSDQALDIWKLSRLKESIEDVEKAIEAAGDVDEETRASVSRAMEWHKTGLDSLNRIEQHRNEIADLPNLMTRLQEAMNQPLAEPPAKLDESVSLESHEVFLQEQRAHEERLQNDFNGAMKLIVDRNDRINLLATEEQELKDQLETAKEAVETHITTDLASRAILVENQAKVVAIKIHLRMITVEHQWLVATEKSAFLNRDWLKRQLEHAQSTTQHLANLVAERRDEIIEAEAEKARKEASDAHPLLKDLAEENAALAEQRTDIFKINRDNVSEQQRLDEQLKAILDARQKLDEHLNAAGHSLAVGLLLRFERSRLPQTSRSQQRLDEIESVLPDLRLSQLDINDQLEKLPTQQSEIEQSVEVMTPEDSLVSVAELKSRANGLLTKKRDYLYELRTEYEKYLNNLARLQNGHRRLLKNTVELRTYIDQHVLWIRSAEPIDSSDFQRSMMAIKSIGTSDQWQAMVRFLSTRLNGRWLLISILLLGLGLGVGMRKQLDRRLRNVCRRRSDFRVSPLIRSLLLTIFQASLLPALVGTLGWLLASPYETETIKGSISHGLLAITPQLFVACFVYRLAIRGGLAETQLGWSGQVCDLIRGATGSISRYCLPLIATTFALELYDGGKWIDSLGRLTFIAAMITLSLASFRLLRGVGNAWKTDPESSRSIWEQTFALWSPPVVIGPISLACVSALGYMYSSVFLGTRLLMTWWLILGVVSGYYLASRVVDIALNIITARRRWRAQTESEFSVGEPGNLGGENEIRGIRAQVTRLLHVSSVALCLVIAFSYWHDAIPAVKAFDYGLWQVNRQVEQLGPDKTMIAITKLTWVTVGDILRFLMIMAATFVLSRNLPGLLQMVILDRLPLDRGGKYAISIVCRYLVAAIGLVLACRMIGFSWSSVQWLVAAMSVGLGFGLQEIFANFVAGIIILLERPIRVGDFVTVNGTTGFVTKIQLRATMIIDYDRRELIVPNKKFITDDVINWTLSDSITRIVIPIGIAYGSDTRLAQSVLLRVARENPKVLRDPKPEVVFSQFGGSSLDFELRVFIPDRETYPQILHQLHMAVEEAFREKDIEIAFPQRDINLKGLEPLINNMAEPGTRKKAG